MEFYKMHSCGNDFCIIKDENNLDYAKLATRICDRKYGVGADGLIIVKNNPLEMIIYNSCGNRENMNVNALCCFARYVLENKIVIEKNFDVITYLGVYNVKVKNNKDYLVTINMKKPYFQNSIMHICDDVNSFGRIITINNYSLTTYSLFLGSTHCIIFVDDLNSNVLDYANDLANNRIFKRKANINFVHIIDENNLEIKTYDKFKGFISSSAEGNAASVIVTNKLKLTNNLVKVKTNTEDILVNIDKKENVFIELNAKLAFTGNIKEDYLEC